MVRAASHGDAVAGLGLAMDGRRTEGLLLVVNLGCAIEGVVGEKWTSAMPCARRRYGRKAWSPVALAFNAVTRLLGVSVLSTALKAVFPDEVPALV